MFTFRKGTESEQERRAREESWELEKREAEETQWFGAALERLEEAGFAREDSVKFLHEMFVDDFSPEEVTDNVSDAIAYPEEYDFLPRAPRSPGEKTKTKKKKKKN